jgi:hypothetical protein
MRAFASLTLCAVCALANAQIAPSKAESAAYSGLHAAAQHGNLDSITATTNKQALGARTTSRGTRSVADDSHHARHSHAGTSGCVGGRR